MKSNIHTIEMFKKYFINNKHVLLPPAPIARSEKSTTLFNIAGMQQFIDIFLGEKQSEVSRAITIQPCIRTNDLDNVGKNGRHHSLFIMMGNFSFGDYFKQEAIPWAWEFVTKVLNIDSRFLYCTVHEKDKESLNIWENTIKNKTVTINNDDNFWRSGKFGPCGYCTEIFFDTHKEENLSLEFVQNQIFNGSDRFLEIWNIVFMEYNNTINGLIPLETKFIDTGIGLERITSVIEGYMDNYQTSLFRNIISEISKYCSNDIGCKIVADHLRSIIFCISDGIIPSNESQGYILRHLIRRSLLYVDDLLPFILYNLF